MPFVYTISLNPVDPRKSGGNYVLLINGLKNRMWKSLLKHISLDDLLFLKPSTIPKFNNKMAFKKNKSKVQNRLRSVLKLHS